MAGPSVRRGLDGCCGPWRRSGPVFHRDRAANAGGAEPDGLQRRARRIRGAPVPGYRLHPAGRPRAVARGQRRADACRLGRCRARHRRDRDHPARRQPADSAALPHGRGRQNAGGVHRHGAAPGGRHRGAGALGRPVHVARRVHGRRVALGFRVSARTSGRYRTVRRIAARLLFHLRRHVHQYRAGPAAARRSCHRTRRCRGCESRRCLRARPHQARHRPQRVQVRARTARGQRIQLRPVRGCRVRRGADATAIRFRDAGRRRLDAGDTHALRRLRDDADPALHHPGRAGLRHDRRRTLPRDHLRVRPRRADRGAGAGHAGHTATRRSKKTRARWRWCAASAPRSISAIPSARR